MRFRKLRKLNLTLLFACIGLASTGFASGNNKPVPPGGFIRNVGQFARTLEPGSARILFKMPAKGMDLYITDKGLSYLFRNLTHIPTDVENYQAPELSWSRIDMRLEGARITPEQMVCEVQHPAKITYYRGRNSVYQTEYNQRIRFVEVYAGIDWVIYFKGTQLKYDFELKAGADPALIRMKYAGDVHLLAKEKMRVLELDNAFGKIREGNLYCHDNQGNAIDCSYKISGRSVSILPEKPVQQNAWIIDPPLSWSSFLGGNGDDFATFLAQDSQENIVLAGYTYSSDIPVASAFQGSIAGDRDAFLSKFNSNGELLWSTYLGGLGVDNINCTRVNGSDEILVSGTTASSDFPVYAGSEGSYFQSSFGGGNSDAFVAKFSSAGARLWASFYGGSNQDSGNELTFDPQGNIYFTGATWSNDIPLLDLGGNSYFDGNVESQYSDAYVVKLNSSGVRVWASLYGGNNGDAGISLTTDAQGNLFIAGNTFSTNFNTKDAGSGAYFQPSLAGGLDIFILKFSPASDLLWATYYGGAGGDSRSSRIECDSRGKVYVVGRSNSASFPIMDVGNGSYLHTSLGGGIYNTPYIMRFDNNGRSEWSTFLSGNGTGWTYDVTIGSNDRVFITGETRAPDFVTLDRGDGTYYQSVRLGAGLIDDAFIMEFDKDAKLKWSTYLGGSNSDYGRCLTITPSNKLYVGGQAKSTDFPLLDPGGTTFYRGNLGSSQDMFIARFSSSETNLPDAQFTSVVACSGDTTFFTNTSTGNTNSWEWDFGDPASGLANTSSEQNPWHIFSSGGTFQVKLKVGNDLGQDSTTQQVQITQSVQASISGLDTVYCANHTTVTMTGTPPGGVYSGNGVTDSKFLPKEANTGMNLIVYTPPAGVCTKPAEIWVRVIDVEQCDPNALDETPLKGKIRLYPNPFDRDLQLLNEDANLNGEARLRLTGIRGELIWEGETQLQTGQQTLALPELAPGVYYLQIIQAKGQLTLPLIRM